MLTFVDKERNITVVRIGSATEGSSERTVIGTIKKPALEISPELKSAVSADEMREIESVIEIYKRADSSERKAAALNLPSTVRVALEYYFSADASEQERKLMFSVLFEGLRQVRIWENKQAKTDKKAA